MRLYVLNACRHQRSVHPGRGILTPPWSSCSTPVGIKDRFTRSRCGKRIFSKPVLNACRHQRSVHAFEGAGPGSPFLVLNACRHQRSVHASPPAGVDSPVQCSTPVGIKDRFTRRLPAPASAQSVLNACRHQRSVHCPQVQHSIGQRTVLNACRHQRSVHHSLYSYLSQCASAQRLSASKIGSQFLARDDIAFDVRAQRLSASKIGSPESMGRANHSQPVLNACRHQRSVHL